MMVGKSRQALSTGLVLVGEGLIENTKTCGLLWFLCFFPSPESVHHASKGAGNQPSPPAKGLGKLWLATPTEWRIGESAQRTWHHAWQNWMHRCRRHIFIGFKWNLFTFTYYILAFNSFISVYFCWFPRPLPAFITPPPPSYIWGLYHGSRQGRMNEQFWLAGSFNAAGMCACPF